MPEKKDIPEGAQAAQREKIEDIMRARERLDNLLQEKFVKRLSVVFTDVCGYTKFMDTRGDIAGRAWIQKHNDIVLPLIESHGGKVLSLMGDGVMSSFEKTEDAVKACIAIQEGLAAYNRKTDPADELHVTIGVNTGNTLVDEDHIAGDVVNVASRIETKADPDQILVSRSTFDDIRGSSEILCRRHGSVAVKGKGKPLELYRVIWRHTETLVTSEPAVRSIDKWTDRRARQRPSILHLEVTREDNRLKISSFEQQPGEVSTVRQYEEIPIAIEKIGARCHEIVETLNACNREGRIPQGLLFRLRELGQVFRDELFTPKIKENLQSAKAGHLAVNIDDKLVQIPWELLHDGQQFLCQRFSMGRLVKTRQSTVGIKLRALAPPLKALILADPRGDLKSAYREGLELRDFMDQKQNLLNASLLSDDIRPDLLIPNLKNFDIVHFAGHAYYDDINPGSSGWSLSKGTLRADDFMQLSASGVMPALVFSNACQSARTEEWVLKDGFHNEIFGLANALILSGVKHYIGTFWEILDEPGRKFALHFYKHLLSGATIGEAVRRGRQSLIDSYGEETIVWASYLLYGDPTFNYMDQIRPQETSIRSAPTESMPGRAEKGRGQTGAEEVVARAPEKRRGLPLWTKLSGAAAVIIAALCLAVYTGVFRTDTTGQEQALLTFYNQGNYREALQAARELAAIDAKIRLSHLIQGDILLRNGDLAAARPAYLKAIDAPRGTELQKAGALIGLGRLASLDNRRDDALRYYEQASQAAPESSQGYISQAMLLSQNGDERAALDLLEKARTHNPQDSVLAAVTQQTRRRLEIANDKQQQERIDQLVQDLLKSMGQPSRALPTDGWSSQPLSVWIMDFKTRGYSTQEGEDTLLLAGITDQLLENGRVQIVERALLDKLLGELKLGSSELADRRTALAVGKLIAARLIVPGTIVTSGPHTQVSLRLIETETGRITAAVNETVGSAVPISELAERIAGKLQAKLDENYPLRGKIDRLEGDTVWLNIGANVGVVEGQRYKAVNRDTVIEVIAIAPEECAAHVVEGASSVDAGLPFEITKQ
ncbi:MAG: CHAT domain-containing protein [Deltaproteobacteria bacterium]|nr:CHAT domain-containing protein [Deltaproteobacteria bacterium]